MLARNLRVVLLVLMACAFGAAWLAGVRSVAALIGASLLAPVVIVVVLVAMSYAVAGVSPAHGGLGETASSLVKFLVTVPFPGRAPAGNGAPVLLVHGYGCNRGAFHRLAPRLAAAGLQPRFHDLEPVYASIDDYAPALHARIVEVLRETGAPRLAVVCHSMGGLAVRACVARFGTDGLGCVITVGTPHAGTTLARLGLGENARQMEPGSAWLDDLERRREAALAIPWLSIWSAHDNIVAPAASARLQGAEELRLEGIGHIAMLDSTAVADAIARRLASL